MVSLQHGKLVGEEWWTLVGLGRAMGLTGLHLGDDFTYLWATGFLAGPGF